MLMHDVVRRLRGSTLFPQNWVPSLRAARVLWRDYAHLKSVATNRAIDAEGNPLPWYTYPAIEFLTQLDFRDRSVFEYGSGMSTLYWARAARHVVSVEDDERWYQTIATQAPTNSRILLETDLANFPEALRRTGETFDVIVVDGPARGRTRLKCCRVALEALRPGGLIILDNSDWLPESARLLRDNGLLEVDMTGFAPICGHVQTTSLFFDRAFNVPPRHGHQPVGGRGSRPSNWEQPYHPVSGDVVECDDERFRSAEDRRHFSFITPDGPRAFEGFSYLGGDDRRCIGIVDADRQRVLLTRHAPNGAGPGGELLRISGMTWTDFKQFISEHATRRYPL